MYVNVPNRTIIVNLLRVHVVGGSNLIKTIYSYTTRNKYPSSTSRRRADAFDPHMKKSSRSRLFVLCNK